MAHSIYDLTSIGTMQVSPSYAQFNILPPFVECSNVHPPAFQTTVGNLWNCRTECVPKRFNIPFVKGDIIPLQFQLQDKGNTTIATPTKGWKCSPDAGNYYIKAELIGDDCETVYSDNANAFCADWWVSFDQRFGSIQTLFVDTGLLPVGLDIFQVKIVTYDTMMQPVQTLYSETFQEVICKESHLLTGYYATVDSLQNRYQVPTSYYHSATPPTGYAPTSYFSQHRVVANFFAESYATETELNDNDKVLSRKVIDTHRLVGMEHLPPYYAKIVANITQADTVQINGGEYKNVSAIERNNNSVMFLLDITAEKVVNISNRNCL